MQIKAGFDPGWLMKGKAGERYRYEFADAPQPAVTVRDQQPFLFLVEEGQLLGCFNDTIGFAPPKGAGGSEEPTC